MQVPHSMDTEVQAEKPVWKNQGVSRGGDTKSCGAQGERDIGGAHNARLKDATKILRAASGGGTSRGKVRYMWHGDLERGRNISTGRNFERGGGYFVSTVGLDEEKVKKYIKEQEMSDAQLDLMTT